MKKMTFKEVGMPTIILFVICLVVAGALAFTNLLTKDKIAENALKTEIAARQAVLEGTEYELLYKENGIAVYAVLVSECPADAASPSDAALWRVWNGINSEVSPSDTDEISPSDTDEPSPSDIPVSNGDALPVSNGDADPVSNGDITVSATDLPEGTMYHIGYVVTSASRGFGGNVEIMVGIDLSQKITGVKILSHSETPGFGANCEKSDWLAQFEGMSGSLAIEKDKGDVDALSGSTITSRAVTSAINKALAEVAETEGRLNA